MPFIQALGYDVFNPMEVMPEFTYDIGTKKGEKMIMPFLKIANRSSLSNANIGNIT